MNVSQTNASLISRILAFLLPLVLAAYWPLFGTGQYVHAGVIMVRLALLAGAAILSLLWIGVNSTPSERRWMSILAGYLGILLIAALLDENVSRGIHNWVRVLAVYAVAIALARPLRHKATGEAFGIALGIAGLLSLGFILFIYLHYAGLSLPTYEQIREFKAQVLRSSGVALNPLASAALLFCALSLCLLRSGWGQRFLAAAIAILASVFTGSRAPLALALVGVAAVCITRLLYNRTLFVRAVACTAIFVMAAAGTCGILLIDPVTLSAATEGRYDIWTVGMEKFVERPLIGYGAGSWHDDLGSRLPGYYEGTNRLSRVRAGGYHSEFVTLLAEGGLLCFIPAMIIFGLLFQSCCRVAFHPATPKFKGQALIFTFFLIFLRATIEVPGMFGSGEDVTDYLAAVFIAIVVSRASLLESRGNVSLPHIAASSGHSAPLFTGIPAEA